MVCAQSSDNRLRMAPTPAQIALGAKIEELRNRLGETQAEFGDRFGVEQVSVHRWETGKSPPARKYQSLIAELAGMTVAEFFYTDEPLRIIPIMGEVGAEQVKTPKAKKGQSVQHVKLSLDGNEQVALRVRGDAMSPVYRDGDVLIGVKLTGADIAKALNRDCIVRTTAGEGYVKILIEGSRPGTYRLRSHSPKMLDLVDVTLEWAAPIIWISRAELAN